jgi:hypothetical protein
MLDYVLPSTIARRCSVDTRTVRRWCRENLIRHTVNPSGHYRVEVGPDGQPIATRPPRLLGRPKARAA